MRENVYKNIFLLNTKETNRYTSRVMARDNSKLPDRDRNTHGNRIKERFDSIWSKNKNKNALTISNNKGTYIEFISSPNHKLTSRSLEHNSKGIKLLNVRNEYLDNGEILNKATVYVPKGKENHFIKKINEYVTDNNRKGDKPKNQKLIASIEDIIEATVESFWIGNKEWIPYDEKKWCEIWLRLEKGNNEIKNIKKLIAMLGGEVKEEELYFPERTIIFCNVDINILKELIGLTEFITEIKRATETASFFVDMENNEQVEWIKELYSRIKKEKEEENDEGICVSILDTGVNNGHSLITPFLKDEDCYAYKTEWGNNDHEGHGTMMAGLGIYGDIQELIESNEDIVYLNNLESYKILPPVGENNPNLYGAITVESVSNLIINKPNKKRIICMAVTAPLYSIDDGRPSSWSAAIDELVAGNIDGLKKIFIVSAGNTKTHEWKDYPNSNKLSRVQNPAQSWNAITVGAYTEKVDLSEDYKGKNVVANYGGLSPHSTTSMTWDKRWPIKPEIVFEGGNILDDGFGYYECEDLSVLTTNYNPQESQFTTICATSSATAKASWMAAQIQSNYIDAWPETIRGLLIHSSEWTDEMKLQFLNGTNKGDYRQLLRTCGYGVPNLHKAIACKNNSVNLIIESSLQPFEISKSNVKTKDMNIHEIPWPREILEEFFDVDIEMKVTLSYFIEPSPGEVGWKDKYRYPSCGLRFDVNGLDSKEEFKSKISKAIQEDNEIIRSTGSGAKWTLGPNNRNLGSIHSDTWRGKGGELATSNLIAVYPTIGWWKERKHLHKYNNSIRYSLIVSISSPKIDIDLYTPIINKVANRLKLNV